MVFPDEINPLGDLHTSKVKTGCSEWLMFKSMVEGGNITYRTAMIMIAVTAL